jgi:hypothetical protein
MLVKAALAHLDRPLPRDCPPEPAIAKRYR